MTQFSQQKVAVGSAQVTTVMVVQRTVQQGGQLTTRGRRVLAILALVPMVITMVLTGQHQASATGTAPTSKQIVVHSGESLWDIAVRVNPDSDPRQTMWDIKLLNHMTDSRLDAGQALIVPTH